LTADSDTGDLGLLTYLLESGSDRIGALDFQASGTAYEARTSEATLDEMVTAADRLEGGLPLPPALETVLLRGTSVGGFQERSRSGQSARRPSRAETEQAARRGRSEAFRVVMLRRESARRPRPVRRAASGR
jgi:hypothetical protein